MDERSMASARAWQDQANAARDEITKLKGATDPAQSKEGERS